MLLCPQYYDCVLHIMTEHDAYVVCVFDARARASPDPGRRQSRLRQFLDYQTAMQTFESATQLIVKTAT